MPQRFSCPRFECDEISFGIAGEHQASRRRQNSCPGWRCVLELPLDVAGGWIDRAQRSPIRLALRRRNICTAIERVARFERLRRSAEQIALLARVYIKQLRLWIVRRRHPVRHARRARTCESAL